MTSPSPDPVSWPAAAPTGELLPAGFVQQVRQQLAQDDTPLTPAALVTALRRRPDTAPLGDADVLRTADLLHADLVGAGPLAPLLTDVRVTDVLVNKTAVWVDRGRGLERAPVDVGTPEQVRRLAQRLAAAGGRRLDDSCPYVDVRLADGSRLHAVLPPVAVDGPYLSLRSFRQRPLELPDLLAAGTVDGPLAELLTAVVTTRLAYLVTGGTGSGKTTLLGALLSLVPPTERIVVVEDSAELRPVHPHVVALQTRMTNVEGVGEVGLRELVRQALRMRPDRIVVGECRGAEVADLLAALNTGHDGGAGTLHVNSPADVPARLEALGLLGGLPRPVLHAQVAAALQVVVHLRRSAGRRLVESVGLLRPDGPQRLISVAPAWRRHRGPGPAAPELARLLVERGVPVPSWLASTGARR